MARLFTAENDGLTAADFLHAGLDHMTAAKLLFESDDPSYFDSAGYLGHMAVELLVKAWLIEVAGEFEGIHNLQALYDELEKKYGVEPLDDEQRDVLKMLDKFEQLRYPNPKQPTEIGDEDLPRIEALVGYLCRSMPSSIPEALGNIEPGRKGGRVLMRKWVE